MWQKNSSNSSKNANRPFKCESKRLSVGVYVCVYVHLSEALIMFFKPNANAYLWFIDTPSARNGHQSSRQAEVITARTDNKLLYFMWRQHFWPNAVPSIYAIHSTTQLTRSPNLKKSSRVFGQENGLGKGKSQKGE